MIYGGFALIIVGIILIVETPESFPFALLLFLGGGALIFFGFKKHPPRKATLSERVIVKYNFRNQEAITALCRFVERTTTDYNLKNGTSIPLDDVVDLIFRRFGDELYSLSIEDINNKHFGFMGYCYICCILLSDEPYNKLRSKITSTFNALVEGFSRDELLNDFLCIMDDCYIDFHIEQLERIETISDLDESLSGNVLIQKTLHRFKEKYNIGEDTILFI